jgi:hypothetical protein
MYIGFFVIVKWLIFSLLRIFGIEKYSATRGIFAVLCHWGKEVRGSEVSAERK